MVTAMQAPASPDPLPEAAPVIRGMGARIAPVGAGRCAGWRLRACALRRFGAGPRPGRSLGAVTRHALRRPPQIGVPRWAGLIMLRPPGPPTPGITRLWSRRAPAWLRARCAPAPPSTRPRPAGPCRGSVAVKWDADDDRNCPACSPSYVHVADYLLATSWVTA